MQEPEFDDLNKSLADEPTSLMQTLVRPLTPEETENVPVIAPKPAESRVRGRIMAAGYRYKLLDHDDYEETRVRSGTWCHPLAVWALFIVMMLMISLLVLVLVLVVGGRMDTGSKHCNEQEYCLTPGCIHTSAAILSTMDEKVDPCNDMYHYACGNWIKDTGIPPGRASINRFSQASDKNDEFLRKFLESGSTEFKGHNLTSLAKLSTAYKSCMDKDALEKVGASRFIELINKLGSWTVVQNASNIKTWSKHQWSLQDSVEASHAIWASPFFVYWLGVDSKNTSQRLLTFSQAGITLTNHDEYLDETRSEKFKQGYLDFATEIAVLLGGDRDTARAKMEDVYQLEKKIAKIFVNATDMVDPLDSYHVMTLKELQALIGPWINLKQYLQMTFQGRDFSHKEKMIVRTPSYFGNLSSIIQGEHREVLANYIMWNTVQHFLPYLPDEYLKATFALSSIESGIRELPPRWQKCMGYAKSMLGFAASAVYVDHHFSPQDKTKVLQTVDNIRREFVSTLPSLDWLDNPTRGRLRDKAKAIAFNIGYPDWILDPERLDDYYHKLELKEGQLFESYISYIVFKTNKEIQKYGKVPDKTEWMMYPITVNAEYNPVFNSVTVPAGILQPPFFSSFYPQAMLYSTIGMVVGHEFTHAFDNSGRMYDKHGNLGNQWTQHVSETYNKRAECMEQQYSRFTLQGIHLNGKTTLGENIADNGALHLGYQAYQKVKEAQMKLPGVNMTEEKLFFTGYAQLMCAIYTPEYQIVAIKNDPHSYPEFRVKGVYDNMPEFSKVFNCPKVQHSKQNQTTCRVW